MATGVNLNFEGIPGFSREEHNTECIVTPNQAEDALKAFEKLVANPGPVVVGATQGASCMGAAYEYLFNLDKELRRRNVRKKVDITWITPEPFLGHFGIGGIIGGKSMLQTFMKMYGIKWKVNTIIQEIKKDKIILSNGEELSYSMSMLMPPFTGAEVVLNSPGIGDEKGFVPTNDGYQHEKY